MSKKETTKTAKTVDYYKECPFEKDKLYSLGKYTGRYDGWNNYSGAFMFEANGETYFVHPTDVKRIKSIKLLPVK